MKRLILLLILIVAIFAVWQRHRLYLRDPLGSVTRNDTREKGAQVYVNAANDVLLQNYNAPMYVTLVQHPESARHPELAGTSAGLHCLAYVACLINADNASLIEGGERMQVKSMSPKTINYVDAQGRDVVVTLR